MIKRKIMELKKGENEYYLTNKHKIDLKVIYTWKYFPVGDSMRKTYDYNYIPLEGFLERYYKHFDNNNWHRWINTIVKPLYDGNPKEWKRIDYDSIIDKSKYIPWFKDSQSKMITMYNELKHNIEFEDDILLFISYMNGLGFFRDINMPFNLWVKQNKYNLGYRDKQIKADRYSLEEIAKKKYGMNLVREKLMNLDWHKK